ncbi:MAG: type III-A CRISPR-associated RAMP protein Csm5 [Tissierellia bacterium]|nr:type III-A CRISPR-associated RAMP protein Csm5 [Tissierellia bacterium]
MATKEYYQAELWLEGPVHIGCGHNLNKKEYILDKQNKRIWVPNFRKLINALNKSGLLAEYEKYLMSGDRRDLNSFLKQSALKLTYDQISQYSYDISSINWDQRMNDLSLTLKDAYYNPYIPGSTIKGALMRNLLYAEQLNAPVSGKAKLNELDRLASQNQRRNPRNSDINRIFFDDMRAVEKGLHSVLTNNRGIKEQIKLARYFQVSDSEPLDVVDLTLSQKIDSFRDRQENKLPIIRESIKPGKRVYFTISIDERFPYDIKDIEESLERVTEEMNRLYRTPFGIDPLEGPLLSIGGGTGFLSKSFMYARFGDQDGLTLTAKTLDLLFKKHKHKQDVREGVSPRTFKDTEYDGSYTEMGLCALHFHRIEG